MLNKARQFAKEIKAKYKVTEDNKYELACNYVSDNYEEEDFDKIEKMCSLVEELLY